MTILQRPLDSAFANDWHANGSVLRFMTSSSERLGKHALHFKDHRSPNRRVPLGSLTSDDTLALWRTPLHASMRVPHTLTAIPGPVTAHHPDRGPMV